MKIKNLFLVFLLLIFITILFSILFFKVKEEPSKFITSSDLSNRGWNSTEIKINNVTIFAWIADDEEKRALGLMHIKKLEENEGIIFIFEDEGIHQFWMKNTYLPLDILFIDKNLKIIDIQSMEPCNMNECILYSPPRSIKYAIEVERGFCTRNGIKIDDEVKIERR